jgi:hypothetical protein
MSVEWQLRRPEAPIFGRPPRKQKWKKKGLPAWASGTSVEVPGREVGPKFDHLKAVISVVHTIEHHVLSLCAKFQPQTRSLTHKMSQSKMSNCHSTHSKVSAAVSGKSAHILRQPNHKSVLHTKGIPTLLSTYRGRWKIVEIILALTQEPERGD